MTGIFISTGRLTVEHRWGVRHPLDFAVRLDARPHLLAFARLRNASASGAYVEASVAPPLMTRVHVELDCGNLRRAEPYRIPAYVIRTDGAGIGLEWCDFAPQAILALIENQKPRARPERRRSPGTPTLPVQLGPAAYNNAAYNNKERAYTAL